MGGERGRVFITVVVNMGGAFGAMGGAFDVVLGGIYVHSRRVVQWARFVNPVGVDESYAHR